MNAEFAFTVTSECPHCGRGFLRTCRRKSDRAKFIGCSRYPECRYTDDFDEYVQMLAVELRHAQRAMHAATAQPTSLAAVDAKLRDLIFACHPDRARESIDGTKVVAVLNDVRAALRAA